MASLRDHHSSTVTKMLFIGESGSGKTGALASLAEAGYNLRIIDTDNGADILKNLFLKKPSKYTESSIDRIRIKTLTEKMMALGGKYVPATATVWQKVSEALSTWKEEDGTSLGPITSWTEKDILVIDSLSSLSDAAFNYHMAMEGKLQKGSSGNEWRRDIGIAQGYIRNLLKQLYDTSVKCNVIIISHVVFIVDKSTASSTMADEDKPRKGFPDTIGAALAPKVGRYFNNTVMAREIGPAHTIYTKTMGDISLKCSAPNSVKTTYPIETGLADLFKDLRS